MRCLKNTLIIYLLWIKAQDHWQVSVALHDRHKTAFNSPFGFFQFQMMLIGLQRAPATFQRMMDQVIQGAPDFTAT